MMHQRSSNWEVTTSPFHRLKKWLPALKTWPVESETSSVNLSLQTGSSNIAK